jgi:hypothetical protein
MSESVETPEKPRTPWYITAGFFQRKDGCYTRWQDRIFTGHISFRFLWTWHTTVYGANAMHWAVNVHTERWGWICFHPPTRTFGGRWPWYFYVSPNGTPSCATFKIGYPDA